MKTRRAEVELTWNGAAVTTKMADYKTSVTYTDPASGESDSLDVTIHDRDSQWTTAWLPTTGDTLTAEIKLHDWEQEGDERSFPCGSFTLDDFSFSGWPVTGTISGVSVPADGAFRETERTKTWENVTIEEIGKDIAGRAGIALSWDVEGDPIMIKSLEQTEKTDCDFYMELCDTYGLSMKIYSQKIVVFDREKYKEKPPVARLGEDVIQSWSWSKTLAGTYTGGVFAYTDPKTEKEINVSIGIAPRILKQSGKADDKADAERQITAAVNKANHGHTKMSVTMMGNASLVASQCVTVVGVGRLSGKYYIDSITHHLGSGYTMDLELSLVESMTEEVVKDAVQRLEAAGVIDSPDYWAEHSGDVEHLDELLLCMAARIKNNSGGTGIDNVEDAMEAMAAAGVVNSPDYWTKKAGTMRHLDTLLIKAANALGG